MEPAPMAAPARRTAPALREPRARSNSIRSARASAPRTASALRRPRQRSDSFPSARESAPRMASALREPLRSAREQLADRSPNRSHPRGGRYRAPRCVLEAPPREPVKPSSRRPSLSPGDARILEASWSGGHPELSFRPASRAPGDAQILGSSSWEGPEVHRQDGERSCSWRSLQRPYSNASWNDGRCRRMPREAGRHLGSRIPASVAVRRMRLAVRDALGQVATLESFTELPAWGRLRPQRGAARARPYAPLNAPRVVGLDDDRPSKARCSVRAAWTHLRQAPQAVERAWPNRTIGVSCPAPRPREQRLRRAGACR